MNVPLARLRPELRPYPLRRLRLPAAGGTLSIVTPRSMLAVMEVDGVPSSDDQPFWAEVWPSSVAVARRLLRGGRLTGVRVVDLGCGVGLAGIGAGRRGAEVHFVDRDPRALRFARFNAEHNGVRRFETRRASWTSPDSSACADLLLLCDVTYERRQHDALLDRVRECLERGGCVLHADPGREAADTFLERAAAGGALVEEERSLTGFEGARVEVRLAWIRERRR